MMEDEKRVKYSEKFVFLKRIFAVVFRYLILFARRRQTLESVLNKAYLQPLCLEDSQCHPLQDWVVAERCSYSQTIRGALGLTSDKINIQNLKQVLRVVLPQSIIKKMLCHWP